jgi:pimeloyl-ACP methyl ester carboxylesterase
MNKPRLRKSLTAFILAAAAALPMAAAAQGQYADVNGLHMYYEVHGTGEPVVLLHGAFSTADSWTPITTSLAKTRKVIVVELEGHGHTKDLDRPLSVDQMSDDIAAMIKQLGLGKVDVLGYSMGGIVTMSLAIHHPESVRRAVVLSAAAGPTKETFDPSNYQQISSITPETFNFPALKDPYTKVAPDPSRWPILVKKVIAAMLAFPGFTADQLKTIKADVLIMGGDRDGFRLESLVATYRAIPGAQLAILPNADHFLPITSPDDVVAVALPFLNGVKRASLPGG